MELASGISTAGAFDRQHRDIVAQAYAGLAARVFKFCDEVISDDATLPDKHASVVGHDEKLAFDLESQALPP